MELDYPIFWRFRMETRVRNLNMFGRKDTAQLESCSDLVSFCTCNLFKITEVISLLGKK